MAVILVVEDEVGIARLLEDVFADEGHEVIIASNGRQALDLAALRLPEIVITDHMMPVMSGLDMIAAYVGDPALPAVPIVLMSSMPEAVIAQGQRQYAAFVRKPFRIYDLVDLAASLLAARK